ncbi:MAG: RNA methyltransferase [Candidatus Micrarchaeia archaeon]
MKATTILIEPEYDRNIGYVSRVIANFGYKKLVIINPKCPVGPDAIKYAKHGIKILRNARKVNSFEKEIKKYDFVIGTSAIVKRNKDAIRDIVPLRKFSNEFNLKNKKVAIVLGREGIGLQANEINLCDLIVTIETGRKYPVLNISHALAVILYEISKKRIYWHEEIARTGEKKALIKIFSKMAAKGKNPSLAIASFRRVIGRAKIKHREAIMLIEILRENSN